MIKYIIDKENMLAVIIPHAYKAQGVHFFTPDDFSQQVAYMQHPSGKDIPPHVHNSVAREVLHTQEVLFIRKGRLRVDLYNDRRTYLESIILEAGDVILLVTGGHGFEVLEDVEMIEVKQGPYTGDRDKTKIPSVMPDSVRIKE